MSKIWTEVDSEYLRSVYPYFSNAEIAHSMGRTISAVQNRAHFLKLPPKKMNGGHFKKGFTPINKGVKMSEDLYKKIIKTAFKPGNIPHNKKYDGHISIRNVGSQKIQYIRISKKIYLPVHRLVYWLINGRIPDGHVVSFRDGDTFNLSADNLLAIPRAVLAWQNKNGGHKLSRELKEAITLNHILNKKINEKQNN